MSKHNVDVCPFCGVKPVLQYGAGIQKYWWSCENPNCFIQPCSPAYKIVGHATRCWNKRHNPTK